MKAIETRYAGCRFRSRLEARWAVFFDTLGIPWDYEPEGITCTWRLSLHEGTFNYLPDFYLPTLDLWAEVKGALKRDGIGHGYVEALVAARSARFEHGEAR